MILSTSHSKSPSMSSGSRGGFSRFCRFEVSVGFQQRKVNHWINFPPRRYFQLICTASFPFHNFEWAIQFRTQLLRWSLGTYVLRNQHYQVADRDAGLWRRFSIFIFLHQFRCILWRLFRLLMYVLHPVSIHCRPGVMSFSFFHPFRLWVKAVVGAEWRHFVCVGCWVIIGVCG